MQTTPPENKKRTESYTASSKLYMKYRAILLGLVLIPLSTYFQLYMEVGSAGLQYASGPFPSTVSLFANCVLFLLVITIVNSQIARLLPAIALQKGEMLVVYAMLVISTAILSIDFLAVLVPVMAYPVIAATPENKWELTLLNKLPDWSYVTDERAVELWWRGHSSVFADGNWQAWLVPVAVWTGVIFVMLVVMHCINTVVRKQWMEHDRLQFPIVELPLRLTDPKSTLLKNRLLWLGFAIAAGISLVNGLHVFFPSLPYVPVKMFMIHEYFPTPPWNAMGWTPISFYPYGVGLGFLLPLDMLFSFWFFYVAWRVMRILGAVYGVYNGTPTFPFMDQQAFGAYMFVGLMSLYSGRKHIAKVIRIATGREKSDEDADEPLGYRTAIIGIILGIVMLCWFFSVLGLGVWIAVFVVIIYFALALAIARMHAEFGPPAHDLHNMGPDMVLVNAFGTRAFTDMQLANLGWLWWFNRAYRSIPIAYQLDSMKMAERSDVRQKYMTLALAIASVVAVVSGFYVYLHFGYDRGAAAKMAGHVAYFGFEAWGLHSDSWMEVGRKADIWGTAAIFWGAAFAYFLYIMKLNVAWWPLHPLGFAVSTSYSIGTLWFPMFLAWAAKLVVLRSGGLQYYRIALPFFLGLILGDFTMGMVWPLIGMIFDVSTYSFMQ